MFKRKPIQYLTLLGILGLWTTTHAQDPAGTIRHTTSAITIDGNADEAVWGTSTEYSNFEHAASEPPEDEADSSARWRGLWDEENLYLYIEVTDDSNVVDDSNDWQDDSVEIYIDAEGLGKAEEEPLMDYGPGAGPTEFNAYQLTILAGQNKLFNGVNHMKWVELAEPLERDDEDVPLMNGVGIVDGTNYRLEVALPWKSLGTLTPNEIIQKGVFGLGFAVNDDDDEEGRDHQIMWATDNGELWHDATTFPPAALSLPEGPGPDIFVKTKVDLGELSSDQATIANVLEINNIGTANALAITSVTVSGPDAALVTIDESPATVAPGGVGEVKYTLTPGRTGDFQFSFEIVSDDVDDDDKTQTVAVSAAVINQAGPWAHYTMDEAADSTEMRDITGHGNHGTFDGVTLGQDALVTGNAATFGGGSQGEILGANLPLTNFSVSMWLNQTDSADLQTLFGHGAVGGTPAFALLVNGGELSWFADDAIEISASGAPLAPNTTYHVAVTYDESGASPTTVLYVNGEEVARQDNAANVDTATEDFYYIGAFASNLPFSGNLDDVQVYNRVLAADTIKALFDVPGSVPGEIVSGGAFAELWLLGDDGNGNQAEFSQEQGMDEAPGSASAQDDDFYFWGVYPDPIGTVMDHEPFTNYDRAHVPGDPFNRIHFNLDADSAAADTDLRMTFALCCFGAADGGPSEHDLVFRLNGKEFFSEAAVDGDRVIEETVKAGEFDAVAGANTIEIERTGGSDSAWVQYDYLRLEASAGSPVARPTGVDPVEGGKNVIWISEVDSEHGKEFQDLLSGAGHTVTEMFITDPTADEQAMLNAADLVVISRKVNSGSYNNQTWDETITAPLVLMSPYLSRSNRWVWFDGDGLADETPASIAADAPDHPIFAGLTITDGVTGPWHTEVDRGTSLATDPVANGGTLIASSPDGSIVAAEWPAGTVAVGRRLMLSAGSREPDGAEGGIGDAGKYNLTADGEQAMLNAIAHITTEPADLAADLLAYYPFDGDIDDKAGNSHGEAMGADPIAFDTGVYGQGVDLNGVDQFIQTPEANEDLFDFGAPDNQTGFTVSAWFRVDGFTKSWQALIAKGEGNRWRIHRQGDTDGFAPVGGAGDIGQGSTSVNDGAVHHMALVSAPGEGVSYYLDGVLIETGAAPTLENNAFPMMIGENPDSRGRTWDGLIDDVALWKRPLSEAEVLEVVNSPVSLGELIGISTGDPVVPEITGISVDAAGVALQLPAGTTYDIEYSTDLETWTVIASDVTGTYTDNDAGRIGSAEGYYRGVVK